ncbi:unnamed protein product [Vitrella brassicaformis CCMP3155]|uniref:Uncharacterized protein n=2 Tax=Vitrella brassicaformis TaxID=1169539 RepID=A0A0G4EV26_VITBC|nr:unnamed protein product [Vitrella brassicaformis CCMP3155]|mmetsp:Transcript_32449/g.80347  ORF Transcript_32449/g.80347 Transcript_32449/m.80347 type:complete len:147 (+) Transcript_32449:31-471(+)|eukprot:CEM02187.1 unnamed protein product [Vitrella brassicaformis CCMP3155]
MSLDPFNLHQPPPKLPPPESVAVGSPLGSFKKWWRNFKRYAPLQGSPQWRVCVWATGIFFGVSWIVMDEIKNPTLFDKKAKPWTEERTRDWNDAFVGHMSPMSVGLLKPGEEVNVPPAPLEKEPVQPVKYEGPVIAVTRRLKMKLE